MSSPSVPAEPRRRRSRASTTSDLPHWSEVANEPSRKRPSQSVAAILRDLVCWAADIAILLTRGCLEDHAAIERVRHYACAWLAGDRCPEVSIDDVLTTTAVIMAGIDRDLRGPFEEDERLAIGAAISA